MPEIARTYKFDPMTQPAINGEEIPWYIDERGPIVEPVNDGMHLLWLPVMVAKPCPNIGRPDGVRLTETEGDES